MEHFYEPVFLKDLQSDSSPEKVIFTGLIVRIKSIPNENLSLNYTLTSKKTIKKIRTKNFLLKKYKILLDNVRF